ncbi:aminotransferase class IV [Arthrobacter sp. EpRS71]|uniref:aminotransferase class IV n=1 Tax=Arthrobacter sp. EpRS71 TaxID=1743141 RepID=UPI0007482BEC|nr:aminotransferase class IV [Arthrobacter sp. EpRS71]KUM35717.1 branched-chain amino acid aminotransferase [Arthrobacter sp. EpRS71]
MTISTTYLNGSAPTAEELAPLAFAGFAHFTAMQVRGGRVRGLDLHLNRLREGSDLLFGHHLPDSSILENMSAALTAADSADSSLMVYISTRPGEFRFAADPDLNVLVKFADPVTPPATPLALDLVQHERHVALVKHVGEVSKTLLLRHAKERGFDDAAFMDRSGRISEATIWNLAFWDGTGVTWPKADILYGVTMQILQRQLRAEGVVQETRQITAASIAEATSAAVLNSWSPGIGVHSIGGQRLAASLEFVHLLHDAYQLEPLERI